MAEKTPKPLVRFEDDAAYKAELAKLGNLEKEYRLLDIEHRELGEKIRSRPAPPRLSAKDRAALAVLDGNKATAEAEKTELDRRYDDLRLRIDVQDHALKLQEGRLDVLRQQLSAAVCATARPAWLKARRSALEALVNAARFLEESRDLLDELQSRGVYTSAHLPNTLNPLGRVGDHSSLICHAVRENLSDGVVTGKEDWLRDVNHDGGLVR